MQGRVATQDIVFLLVSRLIAGDPIGDDEIGEGISRAPSVVALIKYGLVENQVYDWVWNVTHLLHRVVLLLWQTFHQAASDKLWRRHDDGFCGYGLQIRALHVSHLNVVFARNYGHDRRTGLHAIGKFWL